ncbi:MAG: FkbM family methyltransferase, partial [Pseudolabrys sp.]|nr:FkbM family methyltransferase [Pseudolabrys sp.]
LAAWLMPWRMAFKTRAKDSKLWFYVHWRDLIGRHIAKYGVHEPLITAWMAETLAAAPAQGIVVDVGANLGWHVLHAAQFPKVDTVVGFEPDPFNAWLLDRNLAVNKVDKAVVSACAVGARNGIARLFRYRSTNFGRHTLLTDYGYGSRLVPLVDLDSALDALGLGERRVLVLKIDVEGYEPAVIEGAARLLARTDAVVLEYSPDLGDAGQLSTGAMIGRLEAAGFAPHRFDDGHRVAPLTMAELRATTGQMDVIWLRHAAQPAAG